MYVSIVQEKWYQGNKHTTVLPTYAPIGQGRTENQKEKFLHACKTERLTYLQNAQIKQKGWEFRIPPCKNYLKKKHTHTHIYIYICINHKPDRQGIQANPHT